MIIGIVEEISRNPYYIEIITYSSQKLYKLYRE